MPTTDCLFCKIRDGAIPASVVLPRRRRAGLQGPHTRGPVPQLVIPMRHIASLSDAQPDDAEVFGSLMLTGARLANEAGSAATAIGWS